MGAGRVALKKRLKRWMWEIVSDSESFRQDSSREATIDFVKICDESLRGCQPVLGLVKSRALFTLD